MKSLLQTNADLITLLQDRIQSTFQERSKGEEQFSAWQAACAEAHQRYDSLAFPGGLGQALLKLAAGDMPTAETAICFLETYPSFFGSQHIATKLTRFLKKMELPPPLQERFGMVLAAARARKRSY